MKILCAVCQESYIILDNEIGLESMQLSQAQAKRLSCKHLTIKMQAIALVQVL